MSENVTVTAAAKELGVGERTVRRYLDAGKLDGATPAGKQRGVKVTRESLDKLIAERSANGQTPDTDQKTPDTDHNVTDALVKQLRDELARERARGDRLEQTVTEYAEQFAKLADQAQQLQLAQMRPEGVIEAGSTEPQPAPRRTFWQRFTGR